TVTLRAGLRRGRWQTPCRQDRERKRRRMRVIGGRERRTGFRAGIDASNHPPGDLAPSGGAKREGIQRGRRPYFFILYRRVSRLTWRSFAACDWLYPDFSRALTSACLSTS